MVEALEPAEIYRVFAESGKVFAETNHGEYALRLRLYEAEQRLDSKTFVRISNSDIINLRKSSLQTQISSRALEFQRHV